MNTVELQNITKTFGKHTAVDSLSLAVPEGTVYGFIGPNGSGKTTTLRMIMNILYPDSGLIQIFGEQLQRACTDRIGYMPEERGLYRKMKVRELLRFYGELKSGRKINSEVDLWLERLDLAEWANKKVETLSKGMSQKVQFIATIVARPELIILDEPFTGLDPVNAEAIKDVHDMNVAEKMCDFIFMIFKGKKVLDGTLASIQDKYGSDTIRIRTDDGVAALQSLKGVEKINDYGQVQELRMAPDCDPQEILAAIMARTRITSFDIVKPSLHEIFLRIAGPEAREVNHAQDTQAYKARI